MEWTQGIPAESGLYWLYIDKPIDFLQPILFYTATLTHDAAYTTNTIWYDADQYGNVIIDERMYKDPCTMMVCVQDKKDTYWMRIPQPDTNVSDRKE